jgi:hypothetical protein
MCFAPCIGGEGRNRNRPRARLGPRFPQCGRDTAGKGPHGDPSLKDIRVGNDLQVRTKRDTETPPFRAFAYLPCLPFKLQNGS